MTTTTDTTDIFDVIVIGAGPVGENVADRAVQGGLSVAIVERELVGGECSYWACMPTKALLRSTAALRAARRLPGAREAVTGRLDTAAVLQRRDNFASHWKDDGQVSWLQQAGIELYRGQGRISGPRTVEVTSTTQRRRPGHVDRTSRRGHRHRDQRTRSRRCRDGGSGAVDQPGSGRRPTEPPPGWPSSAAVWWPWRWPPPTPASARS